MWLSSFNFSRNLRLLRRWECYRSRRVFMQLRSAIRSWSGSISLPMLTMDSSKRCLVGFDLGCLGGSSLIVLRVAFGRRQFLVSTLLGLISSFMAYNLIASSSSSFLFFLNLLSCLISSSLSACSRQKVKSPLSSGISYSNSILLILLSLLGIDNQFRDWDLVLSWFWMDNKKMEINKPYSKSLKKIINNSNPEQKEIANYFQRSNSQNLHQPTFPSLTSHLPSDGSLGHLRRKAHSMKIATEPSKIEDEQLEPRRAKHLFAEFAKNRRTSLKETIDDIMYTLIQNGEAKVTNIKGMRQQFQKKRLKNLRIVTESQAQPVKKSRTHEQLQAIILNKQIERERRIRKKFVYENPHIQKRVVTRRQDQKGSTPSRDLLSYYPIVDMRQQNQELLMNMPVKTQQYLRRLRQVALHKAFQ